MFYNYKKHDQRQTNMQTKEKGTEFTELSVICNFSSANLGFFKKKKNKKINILSILKEKISIKGRTNI